MTNRLTEQQLQEELLDEVGDFTKAITKKIGQGVGAVTGAGQKVKGVAKRSVDALGKSFQQGKQQTQKAVAGQDYKASQPKAQAQGPGFLKRAAGAVSTGIGKVDALAQKTLDKVDDVTDYNWQRGLPDRSQQTYTGVGGAQIGKNAKSSNLTQKNQAAGMAAKLQKTDAEAQRKAELEKKLGTTGAAATATNTAKTATDKSIARNQKKIQQKQGGVKQSGISQGIDIAGANQGVANLKRQSGVQRDSTGKIVSTPPGKAPAQVDANKDGKDDKTGKPMSKTATDVKNKANVTAGGVQLDPNNPEHKALITAIEKASPGLTKTVNKLDAGSKGKLLKGLQAA
jgi:hypothetical protein